MDESFSFSDEQWRNHVAYVEQKLGEMRRQDVDSRTLCGHVDRGWVYWPAKRRAQHRQLLKDLWQDLALGVPREGKAVFLGGIDGGAKVTLLADPDSGMDADQYLVIDGLRVADAMASRGMIPTVDGLSPMEASALVHEEAWQLAERLAQRAYREKCNLLWMGMFTESDGADTGRGVTLQPKKLAETIRSLIERYENDGIGFSALADALVSRSLSRPEGPVVAIDWAAVYRRAEELPGEDDLFWISLAEDLGTLTHEQADTVFTMIESAAGWSREEDHFARNEYGGVAELSVEDESATGWRYFADGSQSLIRVQITNGPSAGGERYWGQSEGWIAASPGCLAWAYVATDSGRYEQVSEAALPAILEQLDNQPGGVFRDGWRFWGDQARRWSISEARDRAAELELRLANTNGYDTWGAYRADRDEVARLQTFADSDLDAERQP